ncbi:MAG: hypothetical protein MUO59_00910 [Actinobacteria bacterium]|nr:hypothetical protein [Actinomycetota bacterium]
MAIDETGIGRYGNKVIKKQAAVNFSPGPEDLEFTTYNNKVSTASISRAPHGLIASIASITNPTPGIINNSTIMISADNSIVFLSHHAAHTCSNEAVKVMYGARGTALKKLKKEARRAIKIRDLAEPVLASINAE